MEHPGHQQSGTVIHCHFSKSKEQQNGKKTEFESSWNEKKSWFEFSKISLQKNPGLLSFSVNEIYQCYLLVKVMVFTLYILAVFCLIFFFKKHHFLAM